MTNRTFAVICVFLTATICIALVGFIYVSTYVVTGESIFQFRRTTITEPVRGVWDDNIYTNEYLNLRFEMTPEWVTVADADIEAMVELAEELLEAEGTELPEGFWDLTGVLVDMMAVNTETAANVQIIFERIEPIGTRISATDYIEATAAQLEELSLAVDLDFPEAVLIGDYYWHSLAVEMDEFDITTHMRQFINVRDGFVRIIIITYTGEYSPVLDILEMFSPIPEELPEETEE